MNDLISRSELLESFKKSYCGHLGMENSDGMMTFRSICRIIKEQPTAYSVDKVVEELKEKENEQLAEWLELLKWYQQGMEDIPSESGVLPKDVYRAGYIKAIDDFKRIICEELKLYIDHEDYMCVGLSLHKFTRDLAEQLKEGSADNE